MGISGIAATNSMSVMQMTTTDLKDHKSKSIQNEITDVQQQLQKLSSEEDLSVSEKANERKKLQKEKSSLDTELKQHQEELLSAHKREIMLAQMQGSKNQTEEEAPEESVQPEGVSSDTVSQKKLPADRLQTAQPGTVITQNDDGTVILKEALNQNKPHDTNTKNSQADEIKGKDIADKESKKPDNDAAADTNLSDKEIHAMVSADSSMKLAGHLGTIITRTDDGIAILKGEINLDESYGIDTERKQAELDEMQKQKQRESAFQSSLLSEANNTMKSAAETGIPVKDSMQDAAEKNFYVSGLSASPEEQALQQNFQVSIT